MLVGACEALEDDLRALDLPPCGTPCVTRRKALIGWQFVGNSSSNNVAVPNFISDLVPTPLVPLRVATIPSLVSIHIQLI